MARRLRTCAMGEIRPESTSDRPDAKGPIRPNGDNCDRPVRSRFLAGSGGRRSGVGSTHSAGGRRPPGRHLQPCRDMCDDKNWPRGGSARGAGRHSAGTVPHGTLGRVIPAQWIGILAALASAVVWGTGDFAGGVASRRIAPALVLLLGSLSGLLIFLLAAYLLGEAIPSRLSILWSSLAGLSGGLGLVLFYRALSIGPAALVAPTAAVVGAAVPVVVGTLTEGPPAFGQLLGLLLGLGGIWLVSSGARTRIVASGSPLSLALAAGLGFGGFFVFLAQVDRGHIFVPLAVARACALALSAILFLTRRRTLPAQTITALPFVAGILDAGGNLLYLLSIQTIRLDIAAVISSMYPGTTVLLASVVQHEKLSRLQPFGIALCLLAIAFIAAA